MSNLNELKKDILYHLERNTRSSGNKLHLTAYPYIINLLLDIREELVKLNEGGDLKQYTSTKRV